MATDTDSMAFDPGPLGPDEVRLRVAAMWGDLAFDRDTLAALRRDGLDLDGVRLTGPAPYRIEVEGERLRVDTPPLHPHRDRLLDLWRMHFARGLRSGPPLA